MFRYFITILILLSTSAIFANEYTEFEKASELYQFGKDKEAIKIFEKVCKSSDKDSGLACASLGIIYETGVEDKQNYTKAIEYYNIACDKKSVEGCFNLAMLYAEEVGVKQDFSKSIPYFENACNMQDPLACLTIGDYYHDGRGVKKDKAEAIKFYNLACKFGADRGCRDSKK